MLRRRLWTWTVLLLVSLAGVASAQNAPVPLVNQPIYDPEAKRYFAFVRLDPDKTTWDKADKWARNQAFHGVRGRLAIVDSLEVHDFLLRTFHLNRYQYAWIGLRYLCEKKQLEWSDGSHWQAGSFQAWDYNWKQDIYFCNSGAEWAPIAYSAVPEFRWIGKGPGKGYDWAFVEFPTGGP